MPPSDFAPGIQSKTDYGQPRKKLTPGQLVTYVLQKHRTKRRPSQPHLDLRLGTPKTNLFSWAVPKGELPEPGKRRLAPQTQLHAYRYGDFQGQIGHGYGAGTVERKDKGRALITKVTPHSIFFTVAHSRIPQRFALIKIKTKTGRDWLLVNRTDPKAKVPGIGDKPKFRKIDAADIDDALEQAQEVQEKIDGAHGVLNIGPEGKTEAYSVNPRKTGEPIVHTERLGLAGMRADKSLAGTTLRGEMYGTRKGKAIPFKDIAGLLNASIAKSLDKQKAENVRMQTALFDVLKHRGEDISREPYNVRIKLLRDIAEQLPKDHFQLPASATTSKGKRELLQRVVGGKSPRTTEGLILRMPGGKALKFKTRPEETVYAAGTFPGMGRRAKTIGGLTYSLKPGGEPIGRVGSGLSESDLTDIVKNVKQYIGAPIRIGHQGQFESGKHRAPVFLGRETDKAAAYDYRSTQIYLPSAAAKKIIAFAAKIPDDELYVADDANDQYGREDKPHITVLYGLHTQDVKKVRKALAGVGPIKATLGKVSIFSNDDYDVVKVGINSPALHKANKAISKLKNTNSFPTYHPHATIAYVKSGKGKQYVGNTTFEGIEVTVDEIDFRGDGKSLGKIKLDSPEPLSKGGEFEKSAYIRRQGKQWIVYSEKGKLLGRHDSEASANRQLRAIHINKSGEDLVHLQFTDKQGQVKCAVLVEVADTSRKRMRGLSHRRTLPAGYGMFFDKAGAYWMKDVNFPLDILFLDKEGAVLETQHMPVVTEPDPYKPIYVSKSDKAAYALELPAGWFDKQGLKSGVHIRVAL